MITLTLIDVALILTLLFLFTLGFVYGLITALGRVVSIIVGVWGAFQYTPHLANWLQDKYTWVGGTFAEVVLFVLLVGIIMKLVQIIFWALNWTMGLISFVPFLGFFNRLLGGLFALGIGGVTLGLALHVAFTIGIPFFGVSEMVTESIVGVRLIAIGTWLSPSIPHLFDAVKKLIF